MAYALKAVAALDGAGVALVGRTVSAGNSAGSSKERKSENESGGASEHLEKLEFLSEKLNCVRLKNIRQNLSLLYNFRRSLFSRMNKV